MKAFYYFFVLLSALLLISVTSQDVAGQEANTSPQETSGEIERLRRRADEEKAQIQALQTALQKETEESAAQQQLLKSCYYIHENNVKLQFNYLRKTFTNGILAPRNLVIVNL